MRLLSILVLALIAFIALVPNETESAKILATFAFPGRSQYIFAESYLKTLAASGHEVTVINTFENKPVKNMRFIKAAKILDHTEELSGAMVAMGPWERQTIFSSVICLMAECILQDEGVQQLMKSGETFDLVIAETFSLESLYGFAQHFNATLMGFSTYGNDYNIDDLFGNISPLSYSPLISSPRSNPMSFYDRLVNHWEFWVESVAQRFIHRRNMEQQYAKYFPYATKTMDEVLDSFTIVLLGQHFSLSYVRPYLPSMIEVGGLHISHKSKPLPDDIKEFIENSPNGVIYFSLGSNVKSKDLPDDTKETLLKVFSKLKQRVLWKFEDDQLPGKPDNVFISKWFPQPDILAHPKVELFITHGGLLSTIESIYYGKPVLGMPIFGDQFMNVKRVEHQGFGLSLNLQNIKQKELKQTINNLLDTPSYRQAAAKLSELFHDQPESAMDRAIWWTEYVLRHKEAPHLRAPSRDMSFVQLHSLDTLAVLLAVPLILLLLLVTLTCWLLRLPCGGKKKRAVKLKRN